MEQLPTLSNIRSCINPFLLLRDSCLQSLAKVFTPVELFNVLSHYNHKQKYISLVFNVRDQHKCTVWGVERKTYTIETIAWKEQCAKYIQTPFSLSMTQKLPDDCWWWSPPVCKITSVQIQLRRDELRGWSREFWGADSIMKSKQHMRQVKVNAGHVTKCGNVQGLWILFQATKSNFVFSKRAKLMILFGFNINYILSCYLI